MSNENLALYESVRAVPKEAQKKITGGRLNNMTDINPMWRIKTLTEKFGPCGVGWYTDKLKEWTETGANGEIAVFVDIHLYIKYCGEWCRPIFGTGGSMLVSKERNGLYTDDDAHKKAYTDAISVACKALGIGADVYWEKDRTKYTSRENDAPMSEDDAPTTRKGITLSELRDFGIQDVSGMAKYLGEKLGKSIKDLDEEETAEAWAFLERQKAKRQKATEYQRQLNEDDTTPSWEDT